MVSILIKSLNVASIVVSGYLKIGEHTIESAAVAARMSALLSPRFTSSGLEGFTNNLISHKPFGHFEASAMYCAEYVPQDKGNLLTTI